MRALRAADLLELAEICASSEVSAFESGVLNVLRRHVGFDLALFRRKHGYGAVSVGFESALLRAIVPLWPTFIADALRLPKLSEGEPGVVSDTELYGRRQLEAMTVYQLLSKPSGERAGVSLLTWQRGRCLAHLRLGRGRGEFKAVELERLRAFMPQIQLSETLRYVQSKVTESTPALAQTAVDDPPASPGAELSARERDIVSYLGLGYTNEQIATACGSSPYTVRNQLSSAYAKLGVASRAEAVGILARRAR